MLNILHLRVVRVRSQSNHQVLMTASEEIIGLDEWPLQCGFKTGSFDVPDL